MPTRLILIRHGQTAWSLEKRYCSFTDAELDETGTRQARALSIKLKGEDIHALYTSGAKRTVQFAEIVFGGMTIKKIPAFGEMNFGVFEGLRYADIMDRHRDIYQQWLKDPVNTRIPEGESLSGLAGRVGKATKEIISSNKGKTIALVTHAGPIKVILCDYFKLGLDKSWGIKPALAGVNILEFKNG